MGGEHFPPSLLQTLFLLGKDDLKLFHMYGTSETTFSATAMCLPLVDQTLRNDSAVSVVFNYPAGYPLPNYTLYVLDENLHPVPVGFQGEIYIGGSGVAAGYLNNPELTAEKFLINPFAAGADISQGFTTMQRTGDLGRWREDGTIVVEGRISGDTQIKLRGLRIDLREVESAITEASGGVIHEAVVSVRRRSQDYTEFLAAHVVLNTAYTTEDCSQRLELLHTQLELPQYMCPAILVPISHMPKTNSSKLDRKAIDSIPLPEGFERKGEVSRVPLTATESALRTIWGNVLSAQSYQISSTTDFFHAGGTSLTLLDLKEGIQTNFNKSIPLQHLFKSSTLASMARRIDDLKTEDEAVIGWDEETALTPLLQHLNNGVSISQRDCKTIALTGATGYLGRAILQALIENPDVSHIHCLAVRNAASHIDLLVSDKVTLHEGDLKYPRLGLSKKCADLLFTQIDAIIHNGADISYLKTYPSVRLENVQSTKELAEMGLPRMIPYHYISLVGLACSLPPADNVSLALYQRLSIRPQRMGRWDTLHRSGLAKDFSRSSSIAMRRGQSGYIVLR